jgi:hypothetical protein
MWAAEIISPKNISRVAALQPNTRSFSHGNVLPEQEALPEIKQKRRKAKNKHAMDV